MSSVLVVVDDERWLEDGNIDNYRRVRKLFGGLWGTKLGLIGSYLKRIVYGIDKIRERRVWNKEMRHD